MVKKKEKSQLARFMEMSEEEREREVKPFDEEFVADEFGELPASRKKTWEKLQRRMRAEHRRKAGRPRKGQGAKVISLSVEKGLLNRADALARERGLSRAELVAEGLEMVLQHSR